MGWRREGGLGWGTHVNPWLIHANVWQNPLQYCKVIILQLIKINGKKKRNHTTVNNMVLIYSTGNYIQYLIIDYKGKKKENINK